MSPVITTNNDILALERVASLESAKHRSGTRNDLRRLLWSWFVTGKWHYFLLLLSNTGYLLAREKYSAFSIDRVYANSPAGFGWIGRRLDGYLLNVPVHQAVRQRFDFVVRNATEAIQNHLRQGAERVVIVSAPCGLIRDICATYQNLRLQHPDATRRLALYGLDLDYEGRVLAEAQRRAEAADVPIKLARANILDAKTWLWLRKQGPLSLINCIGLAPWLTLEELGSLLRRFTDHLEPGGHVLLDRFNQSRHDKLGRGADIRAHYHTHKEYGEQIRASGLEPVKCERIGNCEGTAYLLRKR